MEKEFQKEQKKDKAGIAGIIAFGATLFYVAKKTFSDIKKANIESAEKTELADLNSKWFLSDAQKERKRELKSKYPNF